MSYPTIIQGGMGAGVSDWRLANTVSRLGQLGVVSGTALDEILARRLQDGDPGDHMRRALAAFPLPDVAAKIRDKYYIDGGKAANTPYVTMAKHTREGPRDVQEMCLVANFVETWLAREGHQNPVGINYLEKIQMPHLASMYGAMLAGVDYVLMGAGIPIRVPGVLDHYVNHKPAEYTLHVAGAAGDDDTSMHFAPRDFVPLDLPPLKRPIFLAIISSNTLAVTMLKKANGKVDGFIIEGQTAGGHNAPPRGKMTLNEAGEPVYGERDVVDLVKMRELGVPFWLAGGYGSHEGVEAALAAGATGVQVGTAFAFADESGMKDEYKRALIAKAVAGTAKVFTNPVASPTGFPFKVALLEGTTSDKEIYLKRPRICDLGYLREPYKKEDGEVGYRCSAEPVTIYLSKGGKVEDTVGRQCVCNALMANIGLQQTRAKGKHVEVGLVTTGDDLIEIGRFLSPGRSSYTAAEVLDNLLGITRNSAGSDVESEKLQAAGVGSLK
jgi:nitronate monooxygenase